MKRFRAQCRRCFGAVVFAVLVFFGLGHIYMIFSRSGPPSQHLEKHSQKAETPEQEGSLQVNRVKVSPNAASDKQRPTFVLHIGPHKMGTTYLQCELGLIPQHFLEVDNYVYWGTCACGCSSSFQWEHIGGWPSYFFKKGVNMAEPLHSNLERFHNKNGILVLEGLARLSPEQRKAFGKGLKKQWQVKVVAGYRPFYDLILSLYNELYKPERPQYKAWPDKGGGLIQPFDLDEKRPVFDSNWVANITLKQGHPTSIFIERYRDFSDDIQIYELNKLKSSVYGNPLMQHFLCDTVPNASHACEASRTGAIGWNGTNHNVGAKLDYDILATAAYNQHLLGFQLRGTNVTARREVSRRIREHQEIDLRRTVKDFPQKCLADSTLHFLYNKSLEAERSLFEWTEQRAAEFDADFDHFVAKSKFCSVDADSVLQSKEWRAFFAEL